MRLYNAPDGGQVEYKISVAGTSSVGPGTGHAAQAALNDFIRNYRRGPWCRSERDDSEAIGRYLATLNNVRATRMERVRRWLRRMTFGAL